MMDRIKVLVRRLTCAHEEYLRVKGGDRICIRCGNVKE